MSQLVVLQGGGAFTANDELDAQILREHPGYVAVLPTADAFENPDDLVQLSMTWAKRLGATVKVCSVYTRADAREQSYADIVSQAGVVYVVGDSPIHLRSVLKDTVVFDSTATAQTEGRSITGETPCPATDGSEERATSFESAPVNCLEDGKTYTAVVTTNKGEFSILLDPSKANG